MAFNGAFTISQGVDPQSFTITDSSIGSDVNLTDRKVYLNKIDGTTLIPSGTTTTFIDWPIANGPLVLTGILTKDFSLSIEVDWVSSSPLPSPSTYTSTQLITFTGNTNTFIYSLIQQLAAKDNLSNDTNFYDNLSKIQTEVDGAVMATTYGDQAGSQSCLDRAYYLQINQSLFF